MSNYLVRGQSLEPNAPLVSFSGQFQVMLQDDGNFVLYQNESNGQKALWASNTVGKGGVVVNFQEDGNLVLYTAGDVAVWASGTEGKGSMILVMQDDGNLVIYPTAVWGSNTAGQ